MSARHCLNRHIGCAFFYRMVLGFLGSVAVLVASCQQDWGGGPIIDPVNGIHTLYTSDMENHLIKTTDEEGNTITLLGQRDEAGIPSKLEAAFVQAPDQLAGGEGTWLDFDEQGRPSRILGSDGTVIRLDWQSSSTVVVSAVSPDGSVQVNTDVPLSPDSITPEAMTQPADPNAKTVGAQDKDVSVVAQQAIGDSVLVIVSVTSACGGTPTINEVLDVNVLVGSTWYNAALQGEGRYSVVIPLAAFSLPADPAKVQKVCDGLGNILSRACKDENYAAQLQADICGGLSAANAKESILNQCRQGFAGLSGVCWMAATGITSATPTPAQASNLICSHLKDAIEVAVAPTTTHIASASALIAGTGQVSSSGTVNLSDAFAKGLPAKLSITAPTQNPSVLSVNVTPSNPGASQGYTASATVNCAIGHTLVLAVTGSDGYAGSSVVASNLKVDTVELSVPGGASGVCDTITLSIDDVVKSTVSLVFGP